MASCTSNPVIAMAVLSFSPGCSLSRPSFSLLPSPPSHLRALSSSPPSSGVQYHPSSPLRSSVPHYQPRKQSLLCRAAEYVFPDPIPEFAQAETEKFKTYLVEKLSKKDIFGDSVKEVVGVCTEILSNFLHTEYGGPGTLLVIPFIDMADTINERGLPGGPQAARAAVVWAQKHVDKDWKEWTGANKKD